MTNAEMRAVKATVEGEIRDLLVKLEEATGLRVCSLSVSTISYAMLGRNDHLTNIEGVTIELKV